MNEQDPNKTMNEMDEFLANPSIGNEAKRRLGLSPEEETEGENYEADGNDEDSDLEDEDEDDDFEDDEDEDDEDDEEETIVVN